jgi:hypothetical protein
VSSDFDDVEALYTEKGFTEDHHFYLIVEGVCSVNDDKLQTKFMEILKKLPRDEIIIRCSKMIRINDKMRMRK